MNILAIGAHFDDVEMGCGGALARHSSQGDIVNVYVASTSGYSNQLKEVIRSNRVAVAESKKAMKELGVDKLFCGRFSTFDVEFNDKLNVDILKIVYDRKIDRVYTHWMGDVHHDHQAVARASLHSCRHVPCLLAYRSNWYQSQADFQGRYYIDISEYWNAKEMAIRAYVTEVKRTKAEWIRYFRNEAELNGQKIGVKYAECFEVVKWLEG